MKAILRSARVNHWIKNLIVFAALIFSKKFTESLEIWLAIEAFAGFCLASSAIYFINDITDRRQDQLHPVKKYRPIASGELSIQAAWIISIFLIIAAVLVSFHLGPLFVVYLLSYVILNFGYNLGLKNVVIIDVMVVAFGFVIRAAAGAVAIGVPISSWLLVCTILLALFLGFGKRRHELVTLGNEAVSHRQSLAHYSPAFIDQMISVVTASTVIAYTFYTLSPEIQEKFGTSNLILTVPFVLYGIFRYLYLVHQKDKGGNPTRLLVTDLPMLICIASWIIAVIVIIEVRL